jgi:predicted metalloprotease with PDZ domain
MIQKDTLGARGLDDLFRLMFTRFDLTGKQWTPEDLVQSASEVAGTDLSSFFQKYIVVPSPLPVQECLATAGFDASILNYSGEAFVTPKQNPSPLAQQIRDRLWMNSH